MEYFRQMHILVNKEANFYLPRRQTLNRLQIYCAVVGTEWILNGTLEGIFTISKANIVCL